MKILIATAACALALGLAAVPAAHAVPLSSAINSGIEAQSGVEQVRRDRRHWRGKHWRQRGYSYGRRCWNSCTGIGPLRICKRKCR